MNRVRYEDDVLAWIEEQVASLRAGEFAALDLDNLAEEIESLGASQKSELRSRLAVLVQHLLKWQYQPERQSRSWRATIETQRDELDDLLEQSPSLHRLLPDILPRAYVRGRRKALEETGLPHLPEACPFTTEQLLGADWLPE